MTLLLDHGVREYRDGDLSVSLGFPPRGAGAPAPSQKSAVVAVNRETGLTPEQEALYFSSSSS